jgi:16S rRNA (cytidine1402-2'-O)-methyltransferase
MPGTLYLVPTPIGNLADITLRALTVLREVDVIAAEDTRHTGLLLHHYDIKKPMLSYQEHNELHRIPEILQRLVDGQNVALVSDAGTPALSDPGFKLIRHLVASDMPVESLPGPTSITVAIAGSGLPTDSFYYGGFLPRTSTKKQRLFTELSKLESTLVFFESPHRLATSLQDAQTILGNRQAVVARELTKLHQEYIRGTLSELIEGTNHTPLKGEIVLLISGTV